jgi:CTP:molybdopterin cytidylyltransferase MocA
VILVLAVALRVSGRLQGRPAAWPFALVPPLAFLGQEVIERVVAGVPADAVLAPPVYAGLAAQLPVALIAYLAARALIGAADTGGLALADKPIFMLRSVPLPTPATLFDVTARAAVFDRLGRAPPRR